MVKNFKEGGHMNQDELKQAITDLKNDDSEIRFKAARALGDAAGDDKFDITEAAPALIQALADDDHKVRSNAAASIYNGTGSGLDLSPYISALKKYINDEMMGMRYYIIPAMVTAAEAGIDLSEAYPELMKQFSAETENLNRTNLAYVFYNLGFKGKDISPALGALVKSLEIPDCSPMYYSNLIDGINFYLGNYPDGKAKLRSAIESSKVSKTNKEVQSLLNSAGL
jgi:hypothetical protein